MLMAIPTPAITTASATVQTMAMRRVRDLLFAAMIVFKIAIPDGAGKHSRIA